MVSQEGESNSEISEMSRLIIALLLSLIVCQSCRGGTDPDIAVKVAFAFALVENANEKKDTQTPLEKPETNVSPLPEKSVEIHPPTVPSCINGNCYPQWNTIYYYPSYRRPGIIRRIFSW